MRVRWGALIAVILLAACATPAKVAVVVPRDGHVEITVLEDGFHPDRIAVERGQLVKLVFTRRTQKSCLKEVVVYASDTETIRRSLPIDQPVEIDVTFARSGELGYTCGMSMYGGAIQVR